MALRIFSIILANFLIGHLAFSQQTPVSPCPNIFQYRFDGRRWYGYIEIPNSVIGQSVKLNVDMSLRDRLQNKDPGSLQLLIPKDIAIQRIIQRQPLEYRVNFPVRTLLPRLTKVVVNQRVICSQISDQAPIVTTINLEHVLQSQLPTKMNPSLALDSPLNEYGQNSFIGRGFGNFEQQQINNPKTGEATDSQIRGKPLQPVDQYCGLVDSKFSVRPLSFGGKEIARGSWPWLVAIYYSTAESVKFKCGGNLISSRAIITAAHCFYNSGVQMKANEILLFLGRYDIKNWNEFGSLSMGAKQLFIHGNFNATGNSMDADIAIVITKDPIQFSSYIRPVCLWPKLEEQRKALELYQGTVVGWGRSEYRNRLSPRPQAVTVRIVDDATCLRSNDQFRILTSNRTFCAGNQDGTGPCSGDSGGGLMVKHNGRWTLRGIVSAALADPIENTCNLREFVVYSDVLKFLTWIRSVIGSYS